jgi:hypothetical protein
MPQTLTRGVTLIAQRDLLITGMALAKAGRPPGFAGEAADV